MIARLVLAVVVAVTVGLTCLLVGLLLEELGLPIADTVGDFLARWAWVFGLLAGLWFFFTGRAVS